MRYVPVEQRARRQPGLRWTPSGYCRMCEGAILVPPGKTKAAALRNWKRVRDPEALSVQVALYKRATWHPWCWDYASLLMHPWPASIAKVRGERLYSCAGCGFQLELAQQAGKRWGEVVPWMTRDQVVGWLKALGADAKWRAGAEVDHVVPLWAGGQHHIGNLQVLCVDCHREKTAREAKVRAALLRRAQGIPEQLAMGLQ